MKVLVEVAVFGLLPVPPTPTGHTTSCDHRSATKQDDFAAPRAEGACRCRGNRTQRNSPEPVAQGEE
jgi:hypothetical protein